MIVPAPLDPLEIAAGTALDPLGRRVPRRGPGRSAPPRVVLEDVVREALVAGPCTVSFSGGRDSSLVLAVACHVARREGLPLPVPISMRHDGPGSDETAWQERVVAHLGVEDWVHTDIADSMDVLGERATALLAVTGVQAPPNAYLHLPVAAVTPTGGTVLTGAGGDEVLGSRAPRSTQVLSGRARPERHDLRTLVGTLAPRSVRRHRRRRQAGPGAAWLTPAARRAVAERRADEDVQVRLRWDVEALAWIGSRHVLLGRRALDRVGAAHGVAIRSPLLDERFVRALARQLGPAGPRSRTDVMAALAGDLLPADVVSRPTKAVFGAMVWGPRFRAWVAARGDLDVLRPEVRELVDLDALRAAWSQPTPPYGTMMLAQQAWLDGVGAQGAVTRSSSSTAGSSAVHS